MEFSLEQALHQGVIAQKEGNLQEAEQLYTSILQVEPKHPVANHNLGLIAIAKNQTATAVQLFATAVEVNSKEEVFWFNYIDALIKNKQFKDAKRIIKKAKKNGFDNKKLKALLSKAKININGNILPQQIDYNLVEYYQAQQYNDAEELALTIIKNSPEHLLGWKVLGAIYGQTARAAESLKANRKAVQIAPQDSEANYNLGVSLQAQGREDEAEECFNKAIALEPDFAEAHSNLGEILLKKGQHPEGLKEKVLGDGSIIFDLKRGFSI